MGHLATQERELPPTGAVQVSHSFMSKGEPFQFPYEKRIGHNSLRKAGTPHNGRDPASHPMLSMGPCSGFQFPPSRTNANHLTLFRVGWASCGDGGN